MGILDAALQSAAGIAIAGGAALAGRQPVRLYDPESKGTSVGVDFTFEAVEFDAVVTVSHRRRAVVTRHPVEEGADITDHTRPEPREIELSEAIVSNTPIMLAAPLRRAPYAAEQAFRQLETWRQGGVPLTLVTDLDVYDQVVIESLDVPRDAKRSRSIHATIQLVEIRTVATTTTKAPKPKAGRNRAAKRVDKGAKAKTEPTQDLGTQGRNWLRKQLNLQPFGG